MLQISHILFRDSSLPASCLSLRIGLKRYHLGIPFLTSSLFSNWFSVLLPLYFQHAAAAAAKSRQSCPTLCDPIDGSPPGSPVLGILQARTLEWVAISFSNAWKWKVKMKSLSRVRPSATSWTAAHQAPPSMGFSRQEYWSGVLLPSPYFQHTLCLFLSQLAFITSFCNYWFFFSTPSDHDLSELRLWW